MAAALETVVKQLEDSGIIAPGKLQNFIPPKAHPSSAEELVAELVKQHHLTAFQAAQVKAGKAKALILGEYTIVDRIGAGGMGQVFKAEHRRMHRGVAIKMLPPAMTKEPAALARFEREVTAAARLLHPNIVSAFDAGQSGAAHFLVMEYVDGKDLSALVKHNGPFSVAKAVNYILQAARGLEFAHGEGVIHRDIKPSNLLLDRKGVLKILDMGLARIEAHEGDTATQAELTGTGTVMGTIDYMAPEQALSTRHADARADIYSLGCTLYYLLAGKAMYSGETLMARLLAHREQPIPSLAEVAADVPEQVEAVFRKMVAKHLDDRYQTMSEVVAALEGCGIGREVSIVAQQSFGPTAESIQLSILSDSTLHKHYKQRVKTAASHGGSKNKRPLLIGAAAAGFLFLLLGVIVIIRNDKGKEIARVEVPQGSTVEVRSHNVAGTLRVPQPGPVAKANGTRPVPATMLAPFDAAQARAGQEAWAKYLGTEIETTNSIGMRLTLIPPGEFLMGSTPEQIAAAVKMAQDAKLKPDDAAYSRIKSEAPQHKVTITRPYWLGTTEVTIGEFKKFVGATRYVTEAEQFGSGNASATKPDDKTTADQKKLSWRAPGYAVTVDSPVTQVTWNDAVQFCNWLSAQEKLQPRYESDGKGGWKTLLPPGEGGRRPDKGRGGGANPLTPALSQREREKWGYRLPTEAEWEYACRAGTTTQFSFGNPAAMLDICAWLISNADGSAKAVGLKLANAFGLFDMHGNVYEWCYDLKADGYYSNSPRSDPIGPSAGLHRIGRGGCWYSAPVHCRSAFHNGYAPIHRLDSLGFRIARQTDGALQETALTATARPSAADPDRSAAELVLRHGGTVVVSARASESSAAERTITSLAALPAGSILLLEIDLHDRTPSDADLASLAGLHWLRALNLYHCPVTDTGLAVLDRLPTLTRLNIGGTKATEALMPKLRSLHELTWLQVNTMPAGVRAAVVLENLPPDARLTSLILDQVSEADVKRVSQIRTLVSVGSSSITDDSIDELAMLPNLATLYIGGSLTNRGLAGLRDLKTLTILFLTHMPQIDDSSLPHLYGLKNVTRLRFDHTNVTAAGVAALQKALPKCTIEWDGPSNAPSPQPSPTRGEGAKPKLAYLDPAFQKWVAETQKLPAEKQLEAVSKKLMELNPGFDGKLTNFEASGPPPIRDGLVRGLRLLTDRVNDISPLGALVGLKALNCSGTPYTRNGAVSDLSPLAELKLTMLDCYSTQVSDLSPLRGMALVTLNAISTDVSDLSPLAGMPLTRLHCLNTRVSDLSPLSNCKTLTYLNVRSTKVTAGHVAALQKALPNCKIEWDGLGKNDGSRQ